MHFITACATWLNLSHHCEDKGTVIKGILQCSKS